MISNNLRDATYDGGESSRAVEWAGHKLGLAEGAVGSVLAAVGTALPETMIPLIAILFGGGAAANEVGIGAILGAPFMLATLAMFVTGVAILATRRSRKTGEVMPVVTAGPGPRHALLRGRLRPGDRGGIHPGRPRLAALRGRGGPAGDLRDVRP